MSTLLLTRRLAGGAAASGGAYEYLRPLYTLPSGVTYNPTTGLHDVDTTAFNVSYSANLPATEVLLTDSGNAVTNGNNLASAISTALASGSGTRIRIPVGVNFHRATAITIGANSSSGWVYIEPTTVKAGTCVAEGRRVTPSDTAVLANCFTTGTNEPFFVIGANANKVRLTGLHLTMGSGYSASGAFNYGLIASGDSYTSTAWSSAGVMPNNIVIDRCYVHGVDANANTVRTMMASWKRTAILGCYFSEIDGHNYTEDSQCILFPGQVGPTLLDNNYFACTYGECVLAGGSGAPITGQYIGDVIIRRNYFDFPTSYHGTKQTKNLLEFKFGERILVEGNTFANYRADGYGSQYFATAFKTAMNGNGRTDMCTKNVTFRLNTFINCSGGLQVTGSEDAIVSPTTSNVEVTGNTMIAPTSDYSSVTTKRALYMGGVNDTSGLDMGPLAVKWNSLYTEEVSIAIASADGVPVTNRIITDNVWVRPDASTDTAWMQSILYTRYGMDAYNNVFSGGSGNSFARNVFADVGGGSVPTGNLAVNTLAALKITTSTMALANDSPAKAYGESSRDAGAPLSLLATATAGCATGVWS